MKRGIVTLDVDHKICKKGDKLTPEQARLLKLFEHMQAEFKIKVKMAYSKADSKFELLDTSVDEESMDAEESEESDSEDQENEPVKKMIKKKANKKDENNN